MDRDRPPIDDRDVVIVSDVHLGPGLDPETGRWSRMEDFFYDRRLVSFIEHQDQRAVAAGRPPVRLILNGDVFDFLLVTDVPDAAEERRLGLAVKRAERKYGLRPTPTASVFKLERIIRGHAPVFDALGRHLAWGGELVVLPGNHDPELFFTAVQARLLQELLHRALQAEPEGDADAVRDRVHISPWFWLEPGRLFVEHGHQYDQSNVITHLLNPVNPTRPQALEPEIDYPVGSLFVRYLHNQLKLRNPYMRNFVSMDSYLRFLGSLDLLPALRQTWRNGAFLLRAVREAPLWAGGRVQQVCDDHGARREALAAELGVGDALRRLEQRWPIQTAHTKARLLRKMVVPSLRVFGVAAAVFVATIYLWALVFNLILTVPWLAEGPFAKAGWLSVLAVLTFAVVAATLRAVGRLLKSTYDLTFEPLHGHAAVAAEALGVRHVSMGHTHDADRRPLPGGGRYINTGTWTPVASPMDAVQPRARQFTFARLDPDGFHLLRWEHEAGEEVTVDLFADPPGAILDRLLPPADATAGGRHRPRG